MQGWGEEVQNVERGLESGQREGEEQKETTKPWWCGFCPFPDGAGVAREVRLGLDLGE